MTLLCVLSAAEGLEQAAMPVSSGYSAMDASVVPIGASPLHSTHPVATRQLV